MVIVDLAPSDEQMHQALVALYFESEKFLNLKVSEYHGPFYSHDIYDWGGEIGLITAREYLGLNRYENFLVGQILLDGEFLRFP